MTVIRCAASNFNFVCVMRSSLVVVFSLMLGLVFASVVSGCAYRQVSSCKAMVGPGWSTVSQPPADAARLLGMQGVAHAGHLIWLHKSKDKVMACRYASGLIQPGCSSSRGYIFEKQNGKWVSDGVVMDPCDANGVSDD